MYMLAAVICGVLGLVAGGIGFTGVLKGVAGGAKAAFFGLIAAAAVLGALGLYATHRLRQ